MTSLTDDEQLQLAIQMSLEEDDSPPRKRRRSSSPSRECKVFAGQASEVPTTMSTDGTLTIQKTHAASTAESVSPQAALSMGFLGIDRKAMEQERLARAGKRTKTMATVSPLPNESHRSDGSRSSLADGSLQDKTHECGLDDPTAKASVKAPRATILRAGSTLRYPRGAIKRTWSSNHKRDDDITIGEVLQKDQLRKAAFSSFQWDKEWFWSKLDLGKTNVMVIMQGKTEDNRREITEDAKAFNPRIKVCFPSMPGQVNCMHSKLMLLFYDSCMRVVIPTANLTQYDWGDDGRMENSVFIIDLPERSEQAKQTVEDLTPFGQELHYFLSMMGVTSSLLDAVLRHDFLETKHLAFIHTVGDDRQYGTAKDRTGYPGLSRAIRRLDLRSDNLQLDFAASSIGALKEDFLNAFYAAAKGQESGGQSTISYKQQPEGYRQNMHVYFPSHDNVTRSIGGPNAAGTINLLRRWYEDPSFPKGLMREYQSTRDGLLSHNKIILGRGSRGDSKGSSQSQRPVAWVYVGSHNLSESAWGRVTFDKTRKEAKINCKNWECGVLVKVEGLDQNAGLPAMKAFEESLDLPFQYPAEGYHGKEPWFFSG